MYSKAEKRFLKVNLISIISLFLLILAGGVVRSSGSGMGCPDWPKCFDQYIPPTAVSQLPKNYKERYVAKRLEKNERFAKLLEKSGYSALARRIRNDERIKIPEKFNPKKTYTEYINRLIGALTGVFLLGNFIFSIKLIKTKNRVFWLSLLNLFLVMVQAWLGSIVVSTNLLAWIITVHMLLAILILGIAIYTYHAIKSIRNETSMTNVAGVFIKFVAVLCVIISVFQIAMGTEVREAVDAVQNQFTDLKRGEWLTEVGSVLRYHKEIALLVVFSDLLLFFLLKRKFKQGFIWKLGRVSLGVVGLQVITGFVLTYFALAPWAQAIHVFLATLLFGAQFYMLLMLNRRSNLIDTK